MVWGVIFIIIGWNSVSPCKWFLPKSIYGLHGGLDGLQSAMNIYSTDLISNDLGLN